MDLVGGQHPNRRRIVRVVQAAVVLTAAAAVAACTGGGSAVPAHKSTALTPAASASAQPQAIAPAGTKPGREQPISALYSLSADSGTLTAAGHKRFTLTMRTVDDHALWFSDRPAHVSGTMATVDFVRDWAGYGFEQTPPNVAIVLHDAPREADTLVAELTHPRYNAKTHTLTAELHVTDQVNQSDRSTAAHFARIADKALPSRFSGVSLFVNDVAAEVRNGCIVAPHITCTA